MKKTYFNLADQLNFNGNSIKIKGNAAQPLQKQETKSSVEFGVESGQVYQAVAASQPQMNSAGLVDEIPMGVYLNVINCSPQIFRISIEKDEKNDYVVKNSVNLNQVTIRKKDIVSLRKKDKEMIVVSGLQVEGKFKYQFIETALHDIDVLIEKGTNPSDITWIVFWHKEIYESYDKEHFEETADVLGIQIEQIETKIEFINYINYKDKSKEGKKRDDTKIHYLSVFAHGQTPRFTGGKETQLSFGYGLDKKLKQNIEYKINFLQSDIESINPDAFAPNSKTSFFTCNTGTAGEDGLRFAQLWANKTRGSTYAFKNARSNYIFINSTMDEINIAFNFPGDRMDTAISDVINGARELGNETIGSIDTEILIKLYGEENRELIEYIYHFMIPEVIFPFSVTEEWKMKRERSNDRDRIDSNGNRYGYANKGSLQYPMVNNRSDDDDIIKQTKGESRGFKMFSPQ